MNDSFRPDDPTVATEEDEDGDLADLLGELRVLLPTAQLLSAFLISVPFMPGFARIVQAEKQVFLATFVLAVASLVLFSAPAVQHRLMRPLRRRESFKTLASRQMLVGACMLGTALVLATQLVLSEVLGHAVGNIAATVIAVLILTMWVVVPSIWKSRKDC
ncbi:DUF6328 family protein [Chitinimonas koreensis]|uniref:DUF6328 family protein n=1 Tax=Chitinimonas koreensis TaxID=356302 RepID=UPI000414F4A3|nr:DUF6328 family protein [Chitinimonas koreensis]QNM96596.1 hypothetical protein H9L41_23045 [Chitinimonas koreensis]